MLSTMVLLLLVRASLDLGPLPEIKPPDAKLVELGKKLFFDPRLSGDGSIGCVKCHDPKHAWADGQPLSTAYPGSEYFRNSKTVLNAVYAKAFYWDGRMGSDSLDDQVRDAITETHYLNMDGRLLLERLKQIPEYDRLFRETLGGEPSFGRTLAAIVAFEKTLVSKNVPFDRYVKGDKDALAAEARAGLEIFQGKAGCAQCHNGPYFSDGKPHATGVPENPDVFENPLRHITFRSMLKFLGVPNYPNLREDPGYFVVSKAPGDFGTFITPSLREVGKTAPYMHNGMLPTLEEVLDFYDRGAGKHRNKSPLLKPLGLTREEKRALTAFLKSLSGDEIIIEVKEFPDYQLVKFWREAKN